MNGDKRCRSPLEKYLRQVAIYSELDIISRWYPIQLWIDVDCCIFRFNFQLGVCNKKCNAIYLSLIVNAIPVAGNIRKIPKA